MLVTETDPTFTHAARLGFPPLMLRPGIHVNPGSEAWGRFVRTASSEDRIDANEALAALEQRLGEQGGQVA